MMEPAGAERSSAAVDPAFAADVLQGLGERRKRLPCRWFYDARGSELFERITTLAEYYPTRAEIEILSANATELARHRAPGSVLVEFGSGSSRKTEILLDVMSDLAAYAPIDVSRSALDEAARRLQRRFAGLRVCPLVGDFASDLALPSDLQAAPRLGFFPGSTIGNFDPEAAVGLLRRFAAVLGPASRLLVGVDLRKPLDILLPAYDDAKGVTAAFNLNLLSRINAELGGDFDVSAFGHEAVWNEIESRIEMHLVSRREQSVRVLGYVFGFAAGERIHTENSYKHTIDGFQSLTARGGWRACAVWTDRAGLFSVHELVAA